MGSAHVASFSVGRSQSASAAGRHVASQHIGSWSNREWKLAAYPLSQFGLAKRVINGSEKLLAVVVADVVMSRNFVSSLHEDSNGTTSGSCVIL
jgi:hypothetical protein